MSLAYTLPPFVLILAIFIIIAAGSEFGFYLGRWRASRKLTDEAPLFGVVEAALLALTGLILGFSFSLAVGRFDNRQRLVTVEATAIRTAALRASFLPEVQQRPFINDVSAYIDSRLALYREYSDSKLRAADKKRTTALQWRLWGAAQRALSASPANLGRSLFAQSVTDAIDASTQQEAAMRNRVPALVSFMLLVTAVSGATLLGYGFGINGARRRRLLILVLCFIISMIVFVIFDLDRPQSGFIQISLQSLRDVQDGLRQYQATK